MRTCSGATLDPPASPSGDDEAVERFVTQMSALPDAHNADSDERALSPRGTVLFKFDGDSGIGGTNDESESEESCDGNMDATYNDGEMPHSFWA